MIVTVFRACCFLLIPERICLALHIISETDKIKTKSINAGILWVEYGLSPVIGISNKSSDKV